MNKVSKYKITNLKKIIFIIVAIISIALLPSIKAKAQIIVVPFNDKTYYLTENQFSKAKTINEDYGYEGLQQYLDSLGENAYNFAIEDGILYYANTEMTEVTIPEGVHTIETCAFQGNIKLKSVTMPDSVVKIGYGAFSSCTNLTTIKLSNSLEEIGEYAFYECSSLVNVKILANITTFGDYCFYGCTSLENIVTKKGSRADEYARNILNCPVTYTSKPTFEKKSLVILKGETYNSKVYNSGDQEVTYSSSNSKVVRVNKNGVIRGMSSGTATIYAKINGTTLKCKVTVRKNNIKERIYQFKKNYTTSSMSDYEIITRAHAYLIKNVTYDHTNYISGTVPKISHTAEGALQKGVAVCDGYAYAFQMIMEYFNIPCKVITGYSEGGGHAWNLVKINDQWYHIDVTFDDPIINGSDANTQVYTTYFLVNDSQIQKSHSWDTENYDKCTSIEIDTKYMSERK